ncbi:PE domain-containing protein [Rhodococcus sp. MEB064]|uniref:PE domain-containing protein n=1 Tax=Rhodococcus sp. MEB064 TaxID=1587522 RepID=UPI0005ACA014|nr:PE domain-containing protein [Rhodococcus sp. MEB064]KIQ19416.1 PE family protein [Rhodococcus sp. MEB064]
MPGHVFVDPEALLSGAAELDAAAVRLAASVTAAAVGMRPPPSGSDEVSLLAARYFLSSAQSFDTAVAASVAELHEAAAALRAQAAGYDIVDSTFSSALSAGGTA